MAWSDENCYQDRKAIFFTVHLFFSFFSLSIFFREKWSLILAAQVLPVIDRLFYTKDEAIMDAAIELVHVLLKKFAKEIQKNHHGG